MKTRTILAITSVAGLAAAATAQDSVSNVASPQPVGASDAVEVYNIDEQVVRYVVDPVTVTTLWGSQFNLFNAVKSANDGQGSFENMLSSGSYISRQLIDSTFNPAGYAEWFTAGEGVSNDNDAAAVITPSGDTLQFVIGFSEFSGNASGVAGAIVDLDVNNPNRLYVERVVAANNGVDANDENSSFGFGAVDASGNLVMRADDFGIGGSDEVSGNNVYRIDLTSRSGFNQIVGSGSTDAASVDVLTNFVSAIDPVDGNTLVSPNIIPEEVSGLDGGRLVTHSFGGDYIVNDNVFAATTDYSATSTRANFQYLAGNALGVAGASGVGSYMTFDNGTDPTVGTVVLFPVDDTGAVVGGAGNSVRFQVPGSTVSGGSIADPIDGFSLSSHDGFFQHRNQIPFRGPNGIHGVNTLPNGDLIVTAVVQYTDDLGGYDPAEENPVNTAIAVGRQDATGGFEWRLAAWTDVDASTAFLNTSLGKPVKDGPGGNDIGYLTTYAEYSFNFAAPRRGPGITPAGVDAAGNVYFIAPVWFPENGDANSDFFKDDAEMVTCLIRGIYTDLGNGDFGYELDVILRQNDVFTGPNSGTDFEIGFINLVDSNSLSSGAFNTGAVRSGAFLNAAPTANPVDEENLGGLIFAASVTYDADGSGTFEADTEAAGVDDEGYTMMFYVQPVAEIATCATGCFDADGDGTVDIDDLLAVLGDFGNPVDGDGIGNSGLQTDVDCTGGNVDIDDLLQVLGAFGDPASAACN